jgi:hypothetical protein
VNGHNPLPWTADEHGAIRDANGELVLCSAAGYLGFARASGARYARSNANLALILRAVNSCVPGTLWPEVTP